MVLGDIFKKYEYTKSPEGTNPLEKVIGLGKYGLVIGLFAAAFKLNEQTTKTIGARLAAAASCAVPCIMGPSTLALVTYAATNYRQKDDYTNYLIGASATIPVYYGWYRTIPLPSFLSIATFIYALVLKHQINEGKTDIFGMEMRKSDIAYYEDLTWTKDPRKEGYTVFK